MDSTLAAPSPSTGLGPAPAYPSAPTAALPPGVSAELDTRDAVLAELVDTVDRLENRLERVLLNPPPSPGHTAPGIQPLTPGRCGLADELEQHNGAGRLLIDRLRGIIDRIDL